MYLLKCIWPEKNHFKNTFIWKAFQSTVKWRFSCEYLWLNIQSLMTLSVEKVQWCDTKLRISPPIIKQCYWNLPGMLHPTRYTRWYTFWCCYGNMLGFSPFPLQNQILPVVAAQSKIYKEEVKWKVGLAYVFDKTRYFAWLSRKWYIL